MKMYFTFLFLVGLQAQAAVFQGPVSSALGGSGRAGMDSAESAFLNPALLPLLKRYELNGYYRDGYIEDGRHSQGYAVGASDNGPDVVFPGALHYIRTRDTGLAGGPADGEIWHAAIGKTYMENYSFGISGYRATYGVEGFKRTEQWNFSVGGMYMISREFGFAYVMDNIAKPGSDVPAGLRQDLKQTVGGMVSVADIARFRLDIGRQERENQNHGFVVMTGLETVTSEFALFRIGYKDDAQINRRYWTAGLSFNGPRLKVDYAIEKSQDHASGAMHSVDLRLPF